MSATGRDQVTTMWDGHLLLLHRSESDRLARLAAWVGRGLDQGEKVLCVEGAEAGNPLFGHLRGCGIDVDAAAEEGRLELLPIEAFSSPGAQDQVVDRALDEGFPALRMSAQADSARTVLTTEAYQDLERRIDRLCRTRPVSAMCRYARRSTTGQVLRDVVGMHVAGVRDPALSSGGAGSELVLRGEVDIANVDVLAATLAAALDAAMSSGRDVVRLDLVGVDFLGVSACRAIVEESAAFRDGGGRLVLAGSAPGLLRVLTLVGLPAVPGLELIGWDRPAG
ncbi:MEDS domain-containing protein [Pseudonocardia xinjiangensis]|uniref:MEDS domain-containing protein n=1 Tax=Pseudonocardia xinjiangensis TaxID=75289 RepID=UPI003D8D6F9A